MNNGFILLWRKFEDTSFFNNSYCVHLAIYLLMQANHEERTFLFNNQELTLRRGECLIGRKAIALKTGIKESTVYDKLKILEKLRFCNIKSNNKFSIITILNYNTYQNIKQQSNSKSNNQATTKQQQSNTPNTLNTLNTLNNNTIVVGKNPTTESRDFFYLKYKETVGKEYVPDFAKDGKIFKDLLKATPLVEVKAAVEAFFKSEDEFIQQAGFTVGVFRTQVNKLRQVKHGNRPAHLRPFMGKE